MSIQTGPIRVRSGNFSTVFDDILHQIYPDPRRVTNSESPFAK